MKNWSTIKFLFGLILLAVSCAPAENKEASKNKIVELEPRDFKSKLSSTADAVLIDVRAPEELPDGIIEGAININFKDPSFSEKINALDKDKPYFVYCYSGKRGAAAAKQMDSIGFNNVSTLKGGFKSWSEEELEIVKP